MASTFVFCCILAKEEEFFTFTDIVLPFVELQLAERY